ncbi:hypothetical protein ACOSP7_013747 [Xanthoceras sorbifolium]
MLTASVFQMIFLNYLQMRHCQPLIHLALRTYFFFHTCGCLHQCRGTKHFLGLHHCLYKLKNHIYTSGASGTNAVVIRGALIAEKPELLTVILPQSLKKQPPESQELLSKVKTVIEKPHNDHLPLIEASSKSFALPSMTAGCSWKHVKGSSLSLNLRSY